jgi:rRNA maturation protein Nop10
MDKILSAFRMRDVQTFMNIYHLLEMHGKTINDVKEYIKAGRKHPQPTMRAVVHVNKEKLEAKQLEKKGGKNCPVCGKRMKVFKVNISRCTQVGGGYNFQWLCKFCGEDIFE